MAASFVTEVLASAGQLEKEEIVTKIAAIVKQVDEMKMEMHDMMQSKHVDFMPNMDVSEELAERVQTLAGEMNMLTERVDKEIKCQLDLSTCEFQTLSSQLEESCGILMVLQKLVVVDDALKAFSIALEQQNYSTAASSILLMESILAKPVYKHENHIHILKVLRTEYCVQREMLNSVLNGAWKAHIAWSMSEDKGSTVTGRTELIIATGSDGKVVKEMCKALNEIRLLDAKLKLFGEPLVNQIIKPITSISGVIVAERSGLQTKVLTLTVNSKEKQVPQPIEVFQKLHSVFQFLHKNFLGSEVKGVSLMQKLGVVIFKHVIDLVVKECLCFAIPTSQKDLERFHDVIALTEKFNTYLTDIKFLPSSDSGLMDYVQNINILFANKKCQQILRKAQQLMTSDIHNTIQISSDKPLGELPPLDSGASATKKAKKIEVLVSESQLSAATFRLPACRISSSAQSLMNLAYETLQEAVESSPQCAVQLFYSVRNIFEMFRSVYPTYHKQNLETLPQLTAVHHNNCMFIAHHLMTLGHQFARQLPAPLKDGAGTFVDQVQIIRTIGTEAFLKQMNRQRDQLLEYLDAAQGFTNVAEEQRYLSAERSIKQCLHQLQLLQKVWQPVLPENIYGKAIGTLLNTVVVEIITCITTLEDISADDATLIHSLLSVVVERTGSLFEGTEGADNPEVMLQKNVRKWRKFKELLLILNASLQGIGDRWADRKGPLAHDFSANEVKQLIRALFQNTDRRANVLAKIR